MDNKELLIELKNIKRALTCKESSSTSSPCCPETNDLLSELSNILTQINLSLNDLDINIDTINLNTDDLESLLATNNDILNNILTTIDIENNETQILLTDIQNTIANIDTNLTNIITNTQVLIDKLNKPCGVDNINVNVCNLETEKAIDTFQVSDCEGNNIGTPQEVKKTVVLNSVTTKICNVQELADALNILDTELIYTPSAKFHIGVDNFYSRDKIIYDSQTQSEVSRVTEYSTDGVTFTTTAPIGTPLIGWYVSPINEYNTEAEILLTAGNTFTINTNEVHSYAISVLGNGTASTIQIDINSPLPITNGYHKQMEFTNLNTQQVTIACGVGDEIRIILSKI